MKIIFDLVSVFLSLVALSLFFVTAGFSGECRLPDGLVANESFNKPDQEDELYESAATGILRFYGSRTEGVGYDKFLNVGPSGWTEYSPPGRISTTGGAISVWVKPGWKTDDDKSHTILSMRWNDPSKGYLVLSQGWWEPEGADRLYFILNNQEHVHCSLPFRFMPGFWTNVTVTWSNGGSGFCRIYIDGKKVAEKHKNYFSLNHQKGPLFIGSDKGATKQAKRAGELFIDDLTIFDRALSETEVKRLYHEQLKEPNKVQDKRFSWLNEGLTLPLVQERTEDGTLIETRVIFDEDILWATSRHATENILKRIKRAGFNVYVPSVWHGKGTYFPSTIARPDPRVVGRIESGDDPLAYLITKAHSMGIEVHPWFTVVKRSNDDYPQFFDSGTPDNAFNVHSPGFRKFIVSLMVDVVSRYDVEGVNLDYIRTMGICDSNFCRDDYKKKQGHGFWPDYALRSVNGASRDRIQEWQDAAVGQILENLSLAAKKIDPDLIISVEGHPKPKDKVRPLDGRDVIGWLKKGWVDIVFAMDYRERIDFETIDDVRSELDDDSRLVVLFGNYEKVGNKVFARPGKLVARYAKFAQRKWPGSGVAFYLYGCLSDEQIAFLKRGPFHISAIASW